MVYIMNIYGYIIYYQNLVFFFLMSNAVDNSIFYVFVMMSSLRTKGTVVVVLVCFFAHETITVLLSTTFSYCLMDGLLNKHSQ